MVLYQRYLARHKEWRADIEVTMRAVWALRRKFLRAIVLLVLCAIIGAQLTTEASETSTPPQWRTTEVVRIIDGDTFVVADGSKIRVRNFDTPELRRWKCQAERARAIAARAHAAKLLQGQRVTLEISSRDRYRRLVADVTIHRGTERVNFATEMIAARHGAPWAYGEEPKPRWCAGDGVALLTP